MGQYEPVVISILHQNGSYFVRPGKMHEHSYFSQWTEPWLSPGYRRTDDVFASTGIERTTWLGIGDVQKIIGVYRLAGHPVEMWKFREGRYVRVEE